MRTPNRTYDFQNDRIVCWWSHGAPSTVASYIALQECPNENVRLVLCDTGGEHPDNVRFKGDIERQFNHGIEVLRNEKYKDHRDVFRKREFFQGPHGAPCTTELKKQIRQNYEQFDDIQVFGYTADEGDRIEKFIKNNPEVKIWCPLYERGITDGEAQGWLVNRGIELPAMYKPQKSGAPYNHNNCIGCPKGGMGYWNKIRIDFPEAFAETAAIERELDYAILKDDDGPVFLDQLDPSRGRFEKEPKIECDMVCEVIVNTPGEKP
jgi:3'-phosphoadenosine 5'-phosphosulfate sulfotransferase (PAPS reductase)/FAD synthetase